MTDFRLEFVFLRTENFLRFMNLQTLP
eukprot:COSAG01_NODE_20561_length_947_cov_99.126179_1_plen_26_part_10